MNQDEISRILAYDETFDCVQCGYCLPACPTYKTMKKETHSPRGRIHLVKMVAEGKMGLDKLRDPIDLCLGCRACERVCPTNVEYGKIFESAKTVLQDQKKESQSFLSQTMEQTIYKHLFPSHGAMDTLGGLLWLYQKSGIKQLVHRSFINKVLPTKLALFDLVTPAVESPIVKGGRENILYPNGKPVYRVGFFQGCVMSTIYSKINDLSMKLLQAAGCEVINIPEQTCCGALQAHSGETSISKELAKQNIVAFEEESIDFIVNNAGGCGAMLSEYDQLLQGDEEWHERVQAFVEKSVDISVLLNNLSLPFDKPIPRNVTYQPSCHMTNVQHVTQEPRDLMNRIEGLRIHELKNPDFCCGSAGIYNLVHYDESMDILDEKMADVKKLDVSLVVTTNPGCLLQMQAGIEREGFSEKMKAVHLVELLAEACDIT